MAAADTPNHPEGADEALVGRRVLLRGISALGLAAFAAPLAACGDDDEPAVTAPQATPEATVETTPEPVPSARSTKSAKPTASAKPTETAAATPKATPKTSTAPKLVKASDTPLAATADIPVNSGMLFEADEYVVTQPTAGDFRGFDYACTHEGCPIDVFDTPGEMDCSCHSSKFKLDSGTPFAGPAKKPVPRKPIIVEGGKIYKAKPA